MLQSFMAMIIVTILWVVIDLVYHLAHLLAALSVTLPNLFFQSRSKYSLVFSSNHTVSIIRFIQAKFAITPALITGAC
jgi:Amt family ammonium transporter